MKRLLVNLPLDALLSASLVVGLIYQVKWALNIGLFVTWFCVVTGLMAAIVWKKIKPEMKKKYPGPRTWYFKIYSWATDIFPVFLLAAFEWWWTAGFLAVVCMTNQVQKQEMDAELLAERAKKAKKAEIAEVAGNPLF